MVLQAIVVARDIGITYLDVKIHDKLLLQQRSRLHMIDRREAIQPPTLEFCTNDRPSLLCVLKTAVGEVMRGVDRKAPPMLDIFTSK